jgi:hypothetical protein
MPFVKNGGLFMPTNKPYRLGDDVFMLLSFMDDPEKLPVAGRVVWISPRGAQGNRTAGIGVQFSDIDKGRARNKSRPTSRVCCSRTPLIPCNRLPAGGLLSENLRLETCLLVDSHCHLNLLDSMRSARI